MLGVYTPKRPSEFFITRMGEINRDLNQKEGRSVPNPFYSALSSLNNLWWSGVIICSPFLSQEKPCHFKVLSSFLLWFDDLLTRFGHASL